MSDWQSGVAEMSLEDKAANGTSTAPLTAKSGNIGGSTKPAGADDFAERARAQGWVKPESYDYETYNAKVTGPGDAKDGDASVDKAAAAEFSTGSSGPTFTSEIISWGANAAKYEWKDDYGDVAPRIPELEKLLFGDEFHQRTGNQLDVLTSIDVTIESETKIKKIKQVSSRFVFEAQRSRRSAVQGCSNSSCHAGEHCALQVQRSHSDPILLYPSCS